MLWCKNRLHASMFFLILMLVGQTHFLKADETAEIDRISPDDVNQLLGQPGIVIIDVRKPRDWSRTSQKILTAVRHDPSKVDQWAGKYRKDKTLIFY